MTIWKVTPEVYSEVETHSKLYHHNVENVPMRMTSFGHIQCKLCAEIKQPWQTKQKCDLSLKNLLSDKEMDELMKGL
jgi:hypothetical protein